MVKHKLFTVITDHMIILKAEIYSFIHKHSVYGCVLILHNCGIFQWQMFLFLNYACF